MKCLDTYYLNGFVDIFLDMDVLYIEFFYLHPVWEMLLWGAEIVFLWTGLSLVFRRCTETWKWINFFLLIMVVIFILWRTLGNRSGGDREICLIPFFSFVAARTTPERYRSLVANILLLIPFGMALPFVLKRHPVRTTVFAAAGFSMIIELIQFIYGLGLCEIDDVIFNTFGTAFGTLAFVCSRRLLLSINRR